MNLFRLLMVTSLFCSSLFVSASYRREDPRYRTIFVQTANNKKIPCSANQNIAVFFGQCRYQGDCKGEQLTLLFDNYEIKEGTEAANKRFNEYKTNVKEAFVEEFHDNRFAPTTPAPSAPQNNDGSYFAGIVASAAAIILWYTY